MRIATFGDLHLTHTPVLDKFRAGEEALLKFDDHLCRRHDQIILMGDIYQTDYGIYPGSRPDVLDAILSRYSRLARRWRASSHQTIFGNHDVITQAVLGAANQIRLIKDGLRLWFIHGHQFDPFIGEGARMPFLVTWMIGGLRRMGLERLADYLEGPLYMLGQKIFPNLDLAAWKALVRGNHDIIVMGHYHQMACRSIGKGVYLNSGECASNTMRYLSIDTQTREVEVRGFSPSSHHKVFYRQLLTA